MKRLRFLLPFFLLLAVAAPVAAEESPAPSDDPVPTLYEMTPAPCAQEIVDAVAAGSGPGMVTESCLLPDGSILPVNVMTIMEPVPAGEIDPMLPPCPEGIEAPDASISSDTPLPCLLADGSIFPVAMPVMADDGTLSPEELAATTGAPVDAAAETTDESGALALYALFAGLGVALLALYLLRRKGSAAA